ncbi:outer membrane beta-barrel protein [Flammeovirga sp. EKP202]|uniref:outer membrane beta-barrel protein n=1 Tax=Flammeovirga sp. EKP202 TaxID=2770592 RepID=UPI00165F32D2|nr:outer membrane beta-barrel protein [Flammeovirga sp. EKP202]MBD0402241.1 hypothetical protein [Flammeovirga sp. EKP202]
MKYLLAILTALVISNIALSQDKLISIGLGTGIYSLDGKINNLKVSGLGPNLNINVYYNYTLNWSFGFEGNLNATTLEYPFPKKGTDYESFLAYTLDFNIKIRYYLGTTRVRPHLGIGIGYYRSQFSFITFSYDDESIEVPFSTINSVNFSPEVGVNFGFFQLVFKTDIVPNIFSSEEGSYLFTNYTIRANININFVKRENHL